MTARIIDRAKWPRETQFAFFRTFDRPHYAVTTRVNVTKLMAARRPLEVSLFRHALWAIGTGLHAVPELCMRFDGETVTQYDALSLSPAIAMDDGTFRFTYLTHARDRAVFDAHAREEIAKVQAGTHFNPHDYTVALDVAYLSCLPWLDYSALDNAMPTRNDCIPRVSWGRIVPKGDGFDMAMTLQVHHAMVDGRQVGQFFEETQAALDDV